MASIFTKIINREIPAYILAEDEHCIAFLDVYPVCKGHTLVVPKQETDYIFDLEDDVFTRLHKFSKHVARGLEKAIPCARIATAVIGLEVPHAHIHLLPINSMQDTNFNKPRLTLSKDEMQNIAEKIRKHL
ncbi:MAG: HIT family protein [Cytophagaceae bacterium]|nr:HIT family protein [Cytophagaceae bacterium]MDW8457382.1 HIT family protein [Cytophagaceae bacterium]